MKNLLLYSSLLFFTLLTTNKICAQQLNVKLFVASDNAGNGPSTALINGNIIPEVTDMYAQVGIDLNLCPVFITNQSWISNPSSFKFDDCIDDLGFISLLVINDQGRGAGAVCQNPNNGLTATRGWAIAGTYPVAHELAHMLSLQHTFFQSFCVGDPADNIFDTSFVPADANNTSHDDFLFSQNPQNWNGCTINWNNITDQCGNTFNYSAAIDEEIRTNVMGEFTDIPPTCSWEYNLTPGQANAINSAITNNLQQYTSSGGDCNDLPNVTTLSGVINGIIENNFGFVHIEGDVQINGEVTINQSTVTASPGATLTINTGGTLNSFSTLFTNDDCNNQLWGGIIAKTGSIINLSRINIENAITGLGLYTTDLTVNYVVITDCGIGLDAALNNGLSHVNLDNMRFINSPTIVSNSALKFRGGKFFRSSLDINEGNVFIEPVAAGIEYNRSHFVASNINYNSGSFLGVTYGRFDQSVTNISECEFTFLCGSLYESSFQSNNSIIINNTGKHDILQNIFNGGPSAVEVQSGESTSLSHYKNNIHDNNATNLNSITDRFIETSCNFHNSHIYAYQTSSGLIDQGSNENIPNNIFESPALLFDIQAEAGAQNFSYFYDDFNSLTLPTVNSSFLVGVFPSVGQFDGCLAKEDLLEPWVDIKLCEPATWNDFCDDTGCTYYIPPPIEYPKYYRFHNNVNEFHDDNNENLIQVNYDMNNNEIELRATNFENDTRSSFNIKVYSTNGVLVASSILNDKEKMLLPYNLSSGLYFSVVFDQHGNVVTTTNFFKE